MTPRATVVHHSRGRMRFRVPAERGHPEYFERVRSELGDWGAIRTNTRTASILVQADRLEGLIEQAAERGVFEVKPEDAPPRLLELVRTALAAFDAGLRRHTDGNVDSATVGFVALVSAAVVQVARGHALPAGGALLMQAIALVMRSDQATEAINLDDGEG